MKKLITIILAAALATPSFAQFVQPRQLTETEADNLKYSNACAVGAGVSLVLTGISAVGTIIYHVEAEEAANHGDRPLVVSRDRSYRNGFAIATAVSALSTGLCTWGAVDFRNRLSDNVVLTGCNGGVSLELGGSMRPMTPDERSQASLLNALRLSTAASGLITMGAATGSLIYYLEYRETIGGDLEGHGARDLVVSREFVGATAAGLALTCALGGSALAIESKMTKSGKVYIKSTVGGFVVEF